SLLGFFGLLYALSEAPTLGWGSFEIIAILFCSVVALALFTLIELTSDNPMLDLRLLQNKVFMVTAISVSLIRMMMMGALFILPVFLQNGMGLSPVQTGLLTMPGALITAVLMPVGGALFDRFGARPVAIVGMVIMTTASFLFINLNVEWSFLAIMIVYMFRSAGMGLTNMPISTAGMNVVPKHLITRATALQNTLRNVAGSMGTAILSLCMTTHGNWAFTRLMQRTGIKSLEQVSAYGVHPSVYGPNAHQLLGYMLFLKQMAFQMGTQYALKVALLITLVAFISVFFLGKKQILVSSDAGAAQALE
ncbi:MAG: MFS transporter, partial [Peptococcaceae bacterium]|nr:MFS transporter [Peptococcaceae bacterium]